MLQRCPESHQATSQLTDWIWTPRARLLRAGASRYEESEKLQLHGLAATRSPYHGPLVFQSARSTIFAG